MVEEGYVTAGYFYEAKSGHRENEPSISSMNIIGDESIALGSLINRYGAKLGISGILTSGGVQFFREGQELSESSAIGALIAEYNTDHLPAELSSAQPVSKLVVVDCSEQPRNVMYCPDDTVLRNVLENMWAVARFQGDYFVQPTGSGSYNEAGFYADGVISSLGQLGSFHGCVDSEMLFHPLHDISIHALVLEGGGIGLRIQGKVYRHVSEGELDSHARIFGAELMHTGARFTARLSALENGWIGVSPVSLLSGVGLERDAIQSMLFPEHIHDSSPIDIRATVNGISVALEVHTNHNGWDPKLTRIPISSGVVYLRGGDAADLDPEITIVVEPDFGEGNHQRIPTKAQSDEIKRISEKIADNLK